MYNKYPFAIDKARPGRQAGSQETGGRRRVATVLAQAGFSIARSYWYALPKTCVYGCLGYSFYMYMYLYVCVCFCLHIMYIFFGLLFCTPLIRACAQERGRAIGRERGREWAGRALIKSCPSCLLEQQSVAQLPVSASVCVRVFKRIRL